ncbi:hypothetical protein ACI3PL_32465, partial [Lacticaseibacillus paracasei]
ERKDRERLNQRPPELTPEDLRKMWEACEEFRVMNEALRGHVRVAEERAITATMVRAMEGAR